MSKPKAGDMLGSAATAICLSLLLVFTAGACSPSMEAPLNESGKVSVHVEIDATTIAVGDPMEVIDPVWWQATIYDGPVAYEASLAPFTKPQRIVWAMLWYEAEVNNGGHDQFYSNSTGIVWRDALAGFDAIGVPEAAAILRESADRLGGNPSLDRAEREEQMDALAPDFDDLDARFYALENAVDIRSRMMDFIRRQPEAFLFSGQMKKPAPRRNTVH